jgi:hypothetical protein
MYVFYSNGTMLTFITSVSNSSTTAGVSDIHNNKGTFFLSIFVGYLLNYTIIIQQDTDSIPEFSPIIFLFVLTTGISVATKVAHASSASTKQPQKWKPAFLQNHNKHKNRHKNQHAR